MLKDMKKEEYRNMWSLIIIIFCFKKKNTKTVDMLKDMKKEEQRNV